MTASSGQSCAEFNVNTASATSDGRTDVNCCQLDHCSFCDYRVCCLVNSCLNTGEQEGPTTDSCIQVTENPAYGLSSKNWLECQQMETPSTKVNNLHQTTEKNSEEKNPITMNYVNISTHSLASIPESRDETVPLKIGHNVSEIETTTADTNKPNFNNYLYTKPRNQEPQEANEQDEYVIDSTKTSYKQCDNVKGRNNENNESKMINMIQKCPSRDKALTMSIIKPHLKLLDRRHQESVSHSIQPKTKSEMNKFRKFPVKEKHIFNVTKQSRGGGIDNVNQSNNLLGYDRLSEITSVKTEESIQEWLMRISEWVDSNSWIKDSCDDDEGISNASEDAFYDREDHTDDKSGLRSHISQRNSEEKNELESNRVNKDQQREMPLNINEALSNASKESPANIPMVVMQCSRLHSHIASKPPFQQTSLPMGTLVTALYQESDWLYIQTPHGVEGFVSSSNCVPIGTMQSPNESKRPWEPCDFPIRISIKNTSYFGRQQGSFVPAKLPTCGGKRTGPFVNMVKMKTNFYSDRHFNYTFKPKDSIKTAKTVTDILKSSPEMEINT